MIRIVAFLYCDILWHDYLLIYSTPYLSLQRLPL